MDKLGLGPAALMEAHPQLIYCSLKGFLPGPYEARTALDEVVQMMGGLSYMTGLPGQPMRAGSSVNDIMGGTFAAVGILAALIERARTGRGRHVQAGLFENNVLLMSQHMSQFAITGKAPLPMGARDVAWPVYDLFDTADGSRIFLGVVTDTQWRGFCEAFGLADLLNDPALTSQSERRAARPRTIPRIAEALRPHARAQLVARFDRLGLPYAPVVAPWELFDDPHLNASGGLTPLRVPGGPATQLPALPLAFDGERPGVRHDLAAVGQHGAEIARELGLTEVQIAALRAAGALV
jgi:crotonobetainyl-CoA:carnitine CoA-transferase CaiB-like acyl-CoA transferase